MTSVLQYYYKIRIRTAVKVVMAVELMVKETAPFASIVPDTSRTAPLVTLSSLAIFIALPI